MPAHRLPPLPKRRHRKHRRVVVAPNTHPRFVAGHVVEAAGNRLARSILGKVMHQGMLGLALGLSCPPVVLEVPHQLLFLRIHQHHRLPPMQEVVGLCIDMLELGVAVRVRSPLAALAYRLQTVAQLMQQSAHRRRTHPPTRLYQRCGELRPTFDKLRSCTSSVGATAPEPVEGRHASTSPPVSPGPA